MSDKLKSKVDLLSSKLREADQDIDNLGNVIFEEKNKNNDLKKSVKDLQLNNSKLQVNINSFEELCVSLKNELNIKDISIKSLEKKINDIEQENCKIKSENDLLQQMLDKEKQQKPDKTFELNRYEEKIKKLIKDIDYEKNKITKLQNDADMYKLNIDRLLLQNKNLETINTSLENKINEIKKNEEKSLSLQEELILQQYHDQIKKLNLENVKLQNDNFTLKQQINTNRGCCCIS